MTEKVPSRGEIFVVDDDPAVRDTLSMVLSAGGYQVTIKFGTDDQYQVWNTDGAGNFVGVATAVATVSGSDMELQTLENTFHQDLNHDGLLFT